MPNSLIRGMFGFLFLATVMVSASSSEPTADEILKKLKPEHPRLFLTKADWDALKIRCEKDPMVKPWFQRQKRRADDTLKDAPIEHKLIGPRLLDQSRRALQRVTLWAAMYRLTGDKKYADRATKEMLVAAAFKDWNPSHFLDTAEMSAALAIGYDWLFDVLSDDEKKKIRQGLMDNGLKQGLDAYTKGGWWTKVTHNWSQVCNGGMTMGALALADEEPKTCGEIIRYGVERIKPAMQSFRPDGGWDEGPGYWSYAMMYNVFFIASIESALGTDFDLKKVPGFGDAGFFRMHSTGPFNQSFNFADAHPGVGDAWQMFWLAKAFGQPAYAAHEMTFAERRADWWHIVWAPEQSRPEDLLKVPTAAAFKRIHVVFMRSAWNEPKALYVGFKGGDNKANHSHLDLGTFVFDALGKRWAEDLGADNYNLPDYFGKKRWTYYRLRTEGHNTITLNGENQDPKAEAPLLAFQHAPGKTCAVADLTAAYKDQKAKRVWRGMALLNNRQVVTIDEVELGAPAEIAWTMHTKAKIEANGSKAMLTLEGEKLNAEILEPADAKFSTASANPPEPQGQQKDVTRLMVKFSNTMQTRLVVCLTPGDAAAPKLELEPLAKWAAAGIAEGPSATGAAMADDKAKEEQKGMKIPAPAAQPQKAFDLTKLGSWLDRLQEHVQGAVQGGAKPTAYMALIGDKAENIKILGADEKGLTVEVGGGKLPVAWKQLDTKALAGLAQAFAGEQDAQGRVLLGVFLMASGRVDDGERELARAMLQDAKVEGWVNEARASVK